MQREASRIVSSEDEQLILVDENDREVGYLDKSSAHDADGILHRAFSVFVFDPAGRLLMQQRSASKRLWPQYWSNSCCSHPRRGETMEVATRRRLQDELNIGADLEFVYKFSYQAAYGELGSENELCWVLLGRTREEVTPNRHEIEATRFMTVQEIEEELAARPGVFTPWFKLEWQRLRKDYAEALRRYTNP